MNRVMEAVKKSWIAYCMKTKRLPEEIPRPWNISCPIVTSMSTRRAKRPNILSCFLSFLKPHLTSELADHTPVHASSRMKPWATLGEEGEDERVRNAGQTAGWNIWKSSFTKQQVCFLGCFVTNAEPKFSAGPFLWLYRQSAWKQTATWQVFYHVADLKSLSSQV